MSDGGDSFDGKVTIGRVAISCIVIAVGYIGWLAATAPETKTPVSNIAEAPAPVEVTRYVLRTVNVREKPNLEAKVMGQHLRGAKITGFLEQNADGPRNWLRLSDNSGFVSTNMLAEVAPPSLDEMLGADYYFTYDARVMTKPDASSISLGQAGLESQFAVGRAGEWIEILWKGGKVAYVHQNSLVSSVTDYTAFIDAAGEQAAAAGDAAAAAAEAAGQATSNSAQY